MIHPICFLQHKSFTWELRLCVCVCVCVCVQEWVQLWCVFFLGPSLFIFACVHTCVYMCVCLKIHQACRCFLQRAAAVGSNQSPLPMSEHTNPFVYLSTCCVCVHVYVSMLIQGRALPNTPWKHSIHQQLEAGGLGPALHFHWERGRQRRGGERRIWGYHSDKGSGTALNVFTYMSTCVFMTLDCSQVLKGTCQHFFLVRLH